MTEPNQNTEPEPTPFTSGEPIPPKADPVDPDITRANFWIKEFDEKAVQENIKLAIFLIYDPKSPRPIIYTRGNTYTITRALVDLTRHFKEKLDEELKI